MLVELYTDVGHLNPRLYLCRVDCCATSWTSQFAAPVQELQNIGH
jgi:hypothetical protein